MFFLPKKAAQKNARTTENRGGPQLRALTDAVGADGLDGAGAGVRGSDPRSPGVAGTRTTRTRPGSEADRWRRRLAGVGRRLAATKPHAELHLAGMPTHALCCACFYAQPVCYCWLYFAPMRSMRTANLSPNRRIVTRFKKNTHANVSIVCTSSDYPSDSKSIMQGPEPGRE